MNLDGITHADVNRSMSTPTAVQFIHRFYTFNSFVNLPLMLVKISSAVELAVEHMSRK